MNAKVTVVLACRSESTRLYGKPLQLVGGIPIIEHILERVKHVDTVGETVVAAADTPSKFSYIDFANRHELPYVIGSEKDVLKRLIDAGKATDADIVVRANTENPYIYWVGLDEVLRRHVERGADLTVTEGLPSGTFVDVHSLDGLVRSHEAGEKRHRSEYTSRYILENPDQFMIATFSPPEALKRPEVRLTVDNPEDLVLVREIASRLADDSEWPATLREILSVIDNEPSLLEINEQYADGTDPKKQKLRPFVYGDE